MDLKNELKSILAANGWTMTDVVKEINAKYGRNDTLQNMSNKLSRGTLRYSEAVEIADVIGCKIEWVKKGDIKNETPKIF